MDAKQRVVGRFSTYHIALVCCLTLLSRVSGFVRDVLFVKLLGAQSASIISDSFLTAFRIPQVVYEILLGGALGSALIPVLAAVMRREGQQAANRLMTALLLIISCIMTLIACMVIYKAPAIIWSIAPGFMNEQRLLAAHLLRIMIFFIVISAVSLLFSEAVRFSRSFVVPALSQIMYNMTFIGGLCWYAVNHASIEFLAWCVLAGGLMQCLLQLTQYVRSSYTFEMPSRATVTDVAQVMRRIVPSILSAGIAEMSFFIELQFASYLPVGSISLLSYASSFMRLPLGIFVYALMTVIFPDMVRISTYAPRRLAFIVYEVTKLLWWLLLPVVLLMSVYAYDIFATLYYAHPLISAHGITLQWLLIIKLLSLPLLAFSKVCVDVLYTLHKIRTPSIVFLCGTVANIIINMLLMPYFGIYGIAVSALAVALVRAVCFFVLVNRHLHIAQYGARLKYFCFNSMRQLVSLGVPLGALLWLVRWILRLSPQYLFFSEKIGLWFWVGPLCVMGAVLMWRTRHYFGINIYFFKRVHTRLR
jgi:putative peptidoglycan lipid II flippase